MVIQASYAYKYDILHPVFQTRNPGLKGAIRLVIDTPIACTAPGKSATMDDFEFDFEDDIAATDEGQPQEAPESMPDRARKNYRQVRARQRCRQP